MGAAILPNLPADLLIAHRSSSGARKGPKRERNELPSSCDTACSQRVPPCYPAAREARGFVHCVYPTHAPKASPHPVRSRHFFVYFPTFPAKLVSLSMQHFLLPFFFRSVRTALPHMQQSQTDPCNWQPNPARPVIHSGLLSGRLGPEQRGTHFDECGLWRCRCELGRNELALPGLRAQARLTILLGSFRRRHWTELRAVADIPHLAELLEQQRIVAVRADLCRSASSCR